MQCEEQRALCVHEVRHHVVRPERVARRGKVPPRRRHVLPLARARHQQQLHRVLPVGTQQRATNHVRRDRTYKSEGGNMKQQTAPLVQNER